MELLASRLYMFEEGFNERENACQKDESRAFKASPNEFAPFSIALS